MFKQAILKSIRWYQHNLSPDHSPMKESFPGGFCRFTPTCSEYGYEAVDKYGAAKGSAMAFWRVMRCNPCSRGGYNPVPGKSKIQISKSK